MNPFRLVNVPLLCRRQAPVVELACGSVALRSGSMEAKKAAATIFKLIFKLKPLQRLFSAGSRKSSAQKVSWLMCGMLLCGMLLVGQAASVQASSACTSDCVEINRWQFGVSLGLGMRSNPLHQGEDMPLVFLPEVSYYGERFFLKNFELGFTLLENSRHQLNALVTPGYDQMYFNRWDPFNFSDGGGLAAAPFQSPFQYVPGGYDVNISNMSGDKHGGGPTEYLPDSHPARLSISQVQGVIVNGEPLLLESSQSLTGVDGNAIWVDVHENTITITGVTQNDQIQVHGIHAEELKNHWSSNILLEDMEDTVNPLNVSIMDNQSYAVADIAHRKMAGLAGLEYSYSLDYASFHVQALTDFTHVHDGHEIRSAVVFPWRQGKNHWSLSLGANYKSRQMLSYYYGIDTRDTDITDLHFQARKAGFERMIRLDWQRPLTEKWSLRAMVQYSQLPDSINDSPLVSDQQVKALFFGGVYHF